MKCKACYMVTLSCQQVVRADDPFGQYALGTNTMVSGLNSKGLVITSGKVGEPRRYLQQF